MSNDTDQRTAEDVSTAELRQALHEAHKDAEDDVERVTKEDILERFDLPGDDEGDDDPEDIDGRIHRIKNAFGDDTPDWLDDLEDDS